MTTSSPDLPALHLGADRPDDARGVGAGDVEGLLVHVERRDRQAEAGPHAVVVDARRHHEDQHLVLADRCASARPRAAWTARAAHAGRAGSPRRTCSSARARAAESRRPRRDPSSAGWPSDAGAARKRQRTWQMPPAVQRNYCCGSRECNAQNTIRNELDGGKTTKLPTPCGNPTLPGVPSRGRLAQVNGRLPQAVRVREDAMKLMWFHLMPYTELPDDFNEKHPSVWVDIHSSLFDPKRAHHMYNDFMDELEYAAEVRLRRGLRERASLERLRPDALAQPDRLVAGAAHHRHRDLRHGQLAGALQSADARRRRIRDDRLHLGRPADRRLPGRHADGHLLRLRPEPEPAARALSTRRTTW